MLAPFTSEPVALAARSVHRVESAKGLEIACVRGAIWVTQERDQRDWVLMAGQSVVLERPGLAVVYAFKDALITVGAAWQPPAGGHAQPSGISSGPAPERPEKAAMIYQIHRYPAELIDVVVLSPGERVVIRPVLPQDEGLTGAFFRACRRGRAMTASWRACAKHPRS